MMSLQPISSPTIDGNVEFEWDVNAFLIMDVDLDTMDTVLYSGDDEVPLNLLSEDDWDRLRSIVYMVIPPMGKYQ